MRLHDSSLPQTHSALSHTALHWQIVQLIMVCMVLLVVFDISGKGKTSSQAQFSVCFASVRTGVAACARSICQCEKCFSLREASAPDSSSALKYDSDSEVCSIEHRMFSSHVLTTGSSHFPAAAASPPHSPRKLSVIDRVYLF